MSGAGASAVGAPGKALRRRQLLLRGCTDSLRIHLMATSRHLAVRRLGPRGKYGGGRGPAFVWCATVRRLSSRSVVGNPPCRPHFPTPELRVPPDPPIPSEIGHWSDLRLTAIRPHAANIQWIDCSGACCKGYLREIRTRR
jgi:hypothetical protein